MDVSVFHTKLLLSNFLAFNKHDEQPHGNSDTLRSGNHHQVVNLDHFWFQVIKTKKCTFGNNIGEISKGKGFGGVGTGNPRDYGIAS